MKSWSTMFFGRRAASPVQAGPSTSTRTYVFVFVPVFLDRGAQAGSRQRGAAGSSDPGSETPSGDWEEDVRQADGPMRASSPRSAASPFWTWFIDNPESRSANRQ